MYALVQFSPLRCLDALIGMIYSSIVKEVLDVIAVNASLNLNRLRKRFDQGEPQAITAAFPLLESKFPENDNRLRLVRAK
jgi:hypothetical protein